MAPRAITDSEQELLDRTVARLRAGVLAIVFAWTGGVGLFVATAWLLVRGGENVGQHLNLLGHYFPGYSVTWLGSFVGLFYGALTGGVLGWTIAWLYNRLAAFRRRKSPGRRMAGW